MSGIDNKDKLRQFIDDAIPELMEGHVDVFLAAMADNKDAMREAMEKAGFSVTEREGLDPDDVLEARRDAVATGRVDTGLGMSIRSRCESRRIEQSDGKFVRTYIWGETEDLANAWLRAYFSRDNVDDVTLKGIRELYDELEKRVRVAPTDPFLGEIGQAGGALVPTLVAAQIFEEANERFVLKNFVQMFSSSGPLQIPRRTVEVTVSRGGLATDIAEDKPETGSVNLQASRVGVITYHDPLVVRAAAVGPIRWVIGQIAEAIAKDDQRVIIAGSEASSEPRGINGLPTSGGNAFDNAQTSAYDNTSVLTERASMRTAYYAVNQPHRETDAFMWVGNSDALRELTSHNDRDQQPWSDENETYLRKRFIESSAFATASDVTTMFGGDFSQYAWVESQAGLRLEQTLEGGKAWESDTIGVKAVQYVDGAPVIPPAFSLITSMEVT